MNNIPKVLHYVWLWGGKKWELFEACLASWKKYCPDYKIIEWNEKNFDTRAHPYCKKFIDQKQWAFASDYIRTCVILEYGGIYLDTDIELFQSLNPLLWENCFFGWEDIFYVWWAIFGATAHHPILQEIFQVYSSLNKKTIYTRITTKIFRNHGIKKNTGNIQYGENFVLYPEEYFYPYAFYESPKKAQITSLTYSVHHFAASWIPKIYKNILFPLVGVYAKIVKIWRKY